MEQDPMKLFFWGAAAMGCFAAGLFFLRFWRDTRDRFFAIFAVAFWALAADWSALAVVNPPSESRHWFYVIRLVAFLAMAIAIADKNRGEAAPRGS